MDHKKVLFLLCFHARLVIDALWSPSGKGLTSWLSFVMSNCEVVENVSIGKWLFRTNLILKALKRSE